MKLLEKLDNWLAQKTKAYKKLQQERIELDTLFINGLQRDFTRELTKQEEKHLEFICTQFIDSRVCEYIFNQIYKKYLEALLKPYGETQEARDLIHNNIQVIIAMENKIKGYAVKPEQQKEFDPHQPL